MIRLQEFPHWIFLFHFSAIQEITCHLFIYAVPGATRRIEKSKYSNNELLVQTGVTIPLPRVPTPLHPCWQV